MEATRTSGLLLMLGAALIFIGINYESLPASFFPVGIVLFPIGLIVFTRANRVYLEAAEERVAQAVNPEIRSATATEHAKCQGQGIARSGDVDSQVRAPRSGIDASVVERDEVRLTSGGTPTSIDIDRGAEDAGVGVSTDVSFPVEIQENTRLAEEIQKLQRLLEDGIIDDQEFSAAKAKILS